MRRRARFCCVPIKWFPKLIFGLALLLVLRGVCSSAPSPILRLAISEDPLSLDPAFITDVSSGAISAKLFDGLVRFDLQGRIQPCLAKSWQISDDGKTYLFTLHDKIFFHNGRKVSARDVVQSLERLRDPVIGSPRRWILERVTRIEAPDDRNLRITLDRPYSPFLSHLAMPNTVVIPLEETQKADRPFGQHPIGSGPFTIERWERDKRLVLKKNPHYFAETPDIDGVEYRVIPEPWAVATEFAQGNLDCMSVGQSQLEEYLADPSIAARLQCAPGLNTYYLGFNCNKPPLNNPKVRNAIGMAIDRNKMAARLMPRRALLAAGPVPPSLMEGMVQDAGLAFDPALARQWLREEGAEGLHLKLYQSSSQDTQEIMEVVQDYLAKVGVEVTIVQREYSSFKDAIAKGEPDMFFLSWWADYPDAENFLLPNFFSANAGVGGNKTHFKDAEFDRLILAAVQETDPLRRDDLYRQCSERVVDQSPWVCLWHKSEWIVVQPWVKGMGIGLVYNADKYTTVRVER